MPVTTGATMRLNTRRTTVGRVAQCEPEADLRPASIDGVSRHAGQAQTRKQHRENPRKAGRHAVESSSRPSASPMALVSDASGRLVATEPI